MKSLKKELSQEIIANAALLVSRKRKHVFTGTRKLAPMESQLRTLRAMGLTHDECATTISRTIDLGVSHATLVQYIAQACDELGIMRPKRVTPKRFKRTKRVRANAAASKRLGELLAVFAAKRGK